MQQHESSNTTKKEGLPASLKGVSSFCGSRPLECAKKKERKKGDRQVPLVFPFCLSYHPPKKEVEKISSPNIFFSGKKEEGDNRSCLITYSSVESA